VDTRQVYMALQALSERYARHGGPAAEPEAAGDLTGYELRVFSQNGEDGVIEEILRRVGVATRSFVEFGIGAGVEGNCVFLADVEGWSGLFMESDPTAFRALEGKYRWRPGVRTVHAAVGPDTIEGLLDEAAVPRDLDVLSIDVDSIDYWIWAAITRVRPRVVVIEYNAHLDPAARLVQPPAPEPVPPWDGSDYFGASLGALRDLGRRKGYRLVHTDLAGVNAFFVAQELAAGFAGEDETPVRAPNYFLRGGGHPPHTGGRAYVEPST
jgi:hypothetical protein